ncbi:galactose oxidase [Rickenella mellea]|uniref:Galactose oxidase n=1 Tax=Rickenella mellea TaxID=50990 RepID=A0A4Y7Q0S1_9AGAM|nr:galactose oxidase [Rickenella mellea]
MAKKKSSNEPTKSAAKAAKKAKAAQKVERKEKKKAGKSHDEEADDEDLESILEKMRGEWEDAHTVTEEITEGPPSRRANATLTACPNGNHLWCIGGEYFSDDGKAYFYNDVFRYSPEKDEWRKFVSPTCPGPRSAHAVVSSPSGGGKLFLFGGEFSSLYQNSFHHYRDFWCFDITTHVWDRIDTKVRPSARSGCRMAMWKHYVFLFGGFYDPGIRTNYFNDLWYFDTQEYLWRQVEFKDADRKPSPRSGFSFLPTVDGIVLHGGYCKEYAKGKRPVGIMLEDTWLLRISLSTPDPSKPKVDPLTFKWEKRKKLGYAPSQRSGCTMALWSNKSLGVLFGGVTDEDTSEETLESVFHNDLFGYQLTGNGRWVSINLKKPKKKTGTSKKGKPVVAPSAFNYNARQDNDSDSDSDDGEENPRSIANSDATLVQSQTESDFDPDDPIHTTPLRRYNAMLAVLRNTLYIYGGIFERGSREYTLDDFYAIQLDKMDFYTCLKPCDVVIPKDGEVVESSSDDEDDDDDDDEDTSDGEQSDAAAPAGSTVEADKKQEIDVAADEDDIETPPVHLDELRSQATAFMGVARDATRSAEDVLSTPLPGETLAMFYARSREYWAGKAHDASQNRGKLLRRDGFALAQERYESYEHILKEVEKILAEAGLDDDDIKKAAAAGPSGTTAQSRNRR